MNPEEAKQLEVGDLLVWSIKEFFSGKRYIGVVLERLDNHNRLLMSYYDPSPDCLCWHEYDHHIEFDYNGPDDKWEMLK